VVIKILQTTAVTQIMLSSLFIHFLAKKITKMAKWALETQCTCNDAHDHYNSSSTTDTSQYTQLTARHTNILRQENCKPFLKLN